MRLTLRTMLAYMDGLLEPDDAEEIGQKLEQSQFASDLLHRTRDAMRRLRLAAPGLTDEGPGLDPNTVAEYLDNTLHDHRVPDFEKVCLESDVHLAEVASCHQILTLVLGEAAEIGPQSRQKMYQLPHLPASDDASQDSQAQAEAEPPVQTEPPLVDRKPRIRPLVPAYLREPRRPRRLVRAVGALVLVGCFAVLVLIASGQFEAGTPLGNLLFEPPQQTARQDKSDPQNPASPTTESESPKRTLPKESTEPADPEAPSPEVPASVEPAPEEPLPDVDPVVEPEQPATEVTLVEPPIETPAETAEQPDETPAPDQEPPARPATPMGRFMSDNGMVLLRYDSEPAAWQRIAAESILVSGQPLVALPTYNPKATLSIAGSSVNLQLLGGSRIELLAGKGQTPPGLAVNFGRVLVMPLAEADTQLRLVLGKREGAVTFADAESVLAMRVTPTYVPGSDAKEGTVVTTAQLYAQSGRLLWKDGTGEGKAIPIPTKSLLTLDENPPQDAVAVGQPPDWIRTDTVSPLDRGASATLAQSLQFDRPAGLGLLELNEHRRKEVVWLATRCLAYVGQFDRMATILNDPDHKLDWPDYLGELRAAATRDEESAEAIRQALQKHYSDQAPALSRMLYGYTNADLEAGQDRVLVEHLADETLAARVLSFWNLKQITGLGLFYKPEQTAAKRKQSIQKWNERLRANQIRIKQEQAPTSPPPE